MSWSGIVVLFITKDPAVVPPEPSASMHSFSTTRPAMQRAACTPKAAVSQQSIRTSLACRALPERQQEQQQVAHVAALAATVSVLSIAFAPMAFADLNVYEAEAGGAWRGRQQQHAGLCALGVCGPQLLLPDPPATANPACPLLLSVSAEAALFGGMHAIWLVQVEAAAVPCCVGCVALRRRVWARQCDAVWRG